MAKKEEVAQKSAREAYIAAYKLGIKYREEVAKLLDAAFGEWDGILSKPGEIATPREVEEIVFNRVFDSTLDYLKTRTFEEIDFETYSEE